MPTPSFFERSKIKEIVILGSKFFWIQLTTLLLFQSNNLIIAHTCGNTSVAEYNIAYKYIGLIEMAFMIIMTPFWSAATDAYARKDYQWIKGILKTTIHFIYNDCRWRSFDFIIRFCIQMVVIINYQTR